MDELVNKYLSIILDPISNFLAFLFLGAPNASLGNLSLTIFGIPPLVLWLVTAGIFLHTN